MRICHKRDYKILLPFENPDHPGNSEKYHSGEKCIENGCDGPAGTAWGAYWCFKCNVKRIKRIDGQLAKILENFKNEHIIK